MKLALRYIPTEVWMDIFRYPWIPRWKKLESIVHKFKNRRFADFLLFYLHNCGKRTLRYLELKKDIVLPQAPMPENIWYFTSIIIRHFDSEALDFLRHASPLFTGVNLELGRGSEWTNMKSLHTILGHLAPLIHGIHSISLYQSAILLIEQYFALKLGQAKKLTIKMNGRRPQTAINFVVNWLTSEERSSTEPKLLEVFTNSKNFKQISMAVQQQFHSAKHRCTFAIYLVHSYGQNDSAVAGFHLENNLGEQLHGQYKTHLLFQIHRHQPNGGTALQEWIDKTNDRCGKSSVIQLPSSLTIGPINANTHSNEVDNADEEEEEEQPSTSAG